MPWDIQNSPMVNNSYLKQGIWHPSSEAFVQNIAKPSEGKVPPNNPPKKIIKKRIQIWNQLLQFLSEFHIHKVWLGEFFVVAYIDIAWKSPSYPWLCIPYGNGCRESMHNCTWCWGCGNEAFIHSNCQAQLKGRTHTNMIHSNSMSSQSSNWREWSASCGCKELSVHPLASIGFVKWASAMWG